MQLPVRVHATTHEGLVHDKNEDSHAVVETDEGGLLLLVCDGMGGMGHGELASALAVDQITKAVTEGRGFPPERLRRAIRDADTVVRTELCNDNRGMPGSTAVMCYLLDGMGHVAWVGDSRAYLIRDGQVVERTRDHKLVDELVAAGQLTDEEARASSLAHVVTRALGGRPPSDRPVKVSLLGQPWKFEHGDVVVLCSDGVCDLIADSELATLVHGVPSDLGARNLVQAALERGGHDNITCIVLSWEGASYLEDETATPALISRERHPDRDLVGAVVSLPPEDDGHGVTEEIEPGWRPHPDEEDTGATSQEIFRERLLAGELSDEAPLPRKSAPEPEPDPDPDPYAGETLPPLPPPVPTPAPPQIADEGPPIPNAAIVAAIAVLITIGLVLALWIR